MKIDNAPQLDFNNVLIRPKRTTLSSRSQVNLEREFTFPNSKLYGKVFLFFQQIWILQEHLKFMKF